MEKRDHVSHKGRSKFVGMMMSFLAYADGRNDLVDIANIMGRSAHELIGIIWRLSRESSCYYTSTYGKQKTSR